MTETYGPAAVCAKHAEWSDRPLERRADLNSRQGVRVPMQEALVVLDPDTMRPVPWDGETMGEIMFRGNITMKGYLKNPAATEAAFAGGWFHTGDLAVVDPDGYVKIRDRSKDIIISGGENISSIEVEEALYRHPAVMSAAVVAQPDEKWGETPCAFIELKPGAQGHARRSCARSAASTWRATRCRAASCSATSPRPRRGRYRNSRCARRRGIWRASKPRHGRRRPTMTDRGGDQR